MKQFFNRMVNISRNRFDPYLSFQNQIEKQLISNESGENILITMINGAYGHTFEGLFARKAMMHGKHVSVLCCNGYLDYCEGIQHESNHAWLRCAVCRAQQENFLSAFGTEAIFYASLLTAEDKKAFNHYTEAFFLDLRKEHVFLGVAIDNILYTALQRHYLIADPIVQNDTVTRGFLHTILATLTVMDRIVNRLHPKYVLSSHGTYSTWGAVVEYCKAHGIYVITYGQNYNHCGIEFTYNDSYLTGDLYDTKNLWMNKQLSEKDYSLAKRFLDERLGRVCDNNVAFDYNKNNKNHYTREQLNDLLGIPSGKKLVGLFPNIPWDGQVTGKSSVFPHFRDWLKTTVDYFINRKDAVLVIRSHPAEVLRGNTTGYETTTLMLSKLYSQLPPNILLLDPKHPINSYTLGENADFAITYSSTVTLELTYIGTPVILCGCPPFRNKNIAFDIASTEDYRALLEQGLCGKLQVDEARLDRLLKYIHYFFFMRTMPQTLVEIHDTVPLRYCFKSDKELDADPVFNAMYHCIEEQADMDFSQFYE